MTVEDLQQKHLDLQDEYLDLLKQYIELQTENRELLNKLKEAVAISQSNLNSARKFEEMVNEERRERNDINWIAKLN